MTETIEYGGRHCPILSRDSENQNICVIRYPGMLSKDLRIIHPFGVPDKTLYLDGEKCTVCENYSYAGTSGITCANRSGSNSNNSRTPVPPSDPDVIGWSSSKGEGPSFAASYECGTLTIRRQNGECLELLVFLTGYHNTGQPVAIAHAGGDRQLFSKEEWESFYDECYFDAQASPNAEVLFAKRDTNVSCFVVMIPVIAIADMLPITKDSERKYGSLTVIGDFEEVWFEGNEYKMRGADQAKALIKYLCEKDATSLGKAVNIQDIRQHLRDLGILQKHRADWRPSQLWKGRLKGLSKLVLCDENRKGRYYIRSLK